MVLGSTLDSGGKITLDREAFKVLASETRIGILKELDKSQMTITDLSKALSMSKATLFEHTDKLLKAGLIKKIDDQRKWVYYKLSWKGKNILHPKRIKIAITLSIFVIAIIVLGSLFYLRSTIEQTDNIAPSIEFLEVEDLNENSILPNDIIIKVTDNKKILKSSIVVEYSINRNYMNDHTRLTNWSRLESRIYNDQIAVSLPNINWDLQIDNYIYIRCRVFDKTGNSAEEMFVEYIERIYENEKDMSISQSDIRINIKKDLADIMVPQIVPISITVHNTGSININDLSLAIFITNPDLNNDGMIDSDRIIPVGNATIKLLENGKSTQLDMNVGLNLTISDHIWVFADPWDIHNESDEQNNMIKINLRESKYKSSIVPEFQLLFIIFILIIIVIFHGRLKSYSLKNPRK
jgi:DNA-binding transcriptional ArsR family regulator